MGADVILEVDGLRHRLCIRPCHHSGGVAWRRTICRAGKISEQFSTASRPVHGSAWLLAKRITKFGTTRRPAARSEVRCGTLLGLTDEETVHALGNAERTGAVGILGTGAMSKPACRSRRGGRDRSAQLAQLGPQDRRLSSKDRRAYCRRLPDPDQPQFCAIRTAGKCIKRLCRAILSARTR